ncbi:MAG: ABC transporter permease [Gammaproteobacteria bacterium]
MLAKEFLQILRDPSTFLIAFVLPMLLLFLFGYAVSLDPTRIRVGIALEDSGAAALSLATSFERSRWFEVTGRRSAQTLTLDLAAGRIRGIVVIPNDFSSRFRTPGKVAQVQIITDGSLPNTATFIAGYAEGVRATWEAGQRHAVRPAIELANRYWFNPDLASRFFLIPGSIAIVMTMIGTLLTALVVAREWERGTMEAIMATPVGMPEFLATKVIPYYLLGMGSMVLCTLVAMFVFGVPFRGSVFGLFALASAFLVPALGQGLLISAVTKNQFVASQVALLSAFLPAMLLSGFLFEISSMPAAIQAITYIVPARYLIPSLQSVFLVGDLWGMFVRSIAILLAFGALFFGLAIHATRRRIA